ncbi:MAG: hypothetical protein JRH20_00350 [Deltaproteobacteria bacterium]|nr:hypothetical protein [Deltaproteobacteria bacterium]
MSSMHLRSLIALAAVAAFTSGCGLIKVKGNLLGIKTSTPSRAVTSTPQRKVAQRSSRSSRSSVAQRNSRNTAPRTKRFEPQVVPGVGYKGPECSQVLADMSKIKSRSDVRYTKQRKDNALDKQIYLLVCAREQKTQRRSDPLIQPTTVRSMNVTPLHFQFDDRRFDHVSAAMISIHWGNYPKPRRAFSSNNYTNLWGIAKTYADHVDTAQLLAQLGTLKIPAEAAKFFIARFEKAKAKVIESIATMEPAIKPMMVQLPTKVLAERKAYFSKYAAFYKRLDALKGTANAERAAGNTQSVITKLTQLRSDYIKMCARLACQYTPIYAELSRELAVSYVAAKDALGARLESQPFMRDGSYVVSFAQDLGVQQRHAGAKLATAWNKYQKAKRGGVDEQTARSVAGGPAANFDKRRMMIWPKTSIPNFGAALGRSKSKTFKAKIASIKRIKGGVRVSFAKVRYKVSVPYACRRTRRVSRIQSDGRLQYERICKWKKVSRVRLTAQPVVLPKAEARQLRRGDEVRGLRIEDQGRVIRVERNKKAIQLRQDPIRS